MKHSIALIAILACFGAHAGGSHSAPPVVGGGGSLNNNTGGNAAQQQTQSTSIGITTIAASLASGGKATATGGAGGLGGTGGQVLGSGNTTLQSGAVAGGSLDMAGAKFGGDTIVPKQAPSVSMTAPTQPITSCRLGISLFGSSSGGAGGGGIPAGNDATCLAGAKLEAMKRAGGFSVESMQRVACTIEGMADLPECKRLGDGERAAAILEDRPAPVAQQRAPWLAGG